MRHVDGVQGRVIETMCFVMLTLNTVIFNVVTRKNKATYMREVQEYNGCYPEADTKRLRNS